MIELLKIVLPLLLISGLMTAVGILFSGMGFDGGEKK